MRIIFGKFGGRTLLTPTRGVSSDFRPTTDRVKEAIFSSLLSLYDLDDANVLDLYAGSGSLGIEAISRGAGSCVFVEKESKLVNFLKKSIDQFEIQNQSSVISKHVFAALKDLGEKNESYDVVFADPPYDHHPGDDLVNKILEFGLIKSGSVIIVEAGKKTQMSSDLSSTHFKAKLVKSKEYGDTSIYIYICKSNNQ